MLFSIKDAKHHASITGRVHILCKLAHAIATSQINVYLYILMDMSISVVGQSGISIILMDIQLFKNRVFQ